MLIRLLPTPSQPTVLFKLNFEDLPDNLQLPSAWGNQLAAFAVDDIEVPKLLHAFDKSVGLQCVLEEVRVDLVKRTVKCSFIDGEVEEWPIEEESERQCGCPYKQYKGTLGCGLCRRGPTLTERLESVLDDVNESAKELDHERKQEEEKTRLLEQGLDQGMDQGNVKNDDLVSAAATQSLSLNAPPGSLKGAAKKQRSILMNLVASLLPAGGSNRSDATSSPRSPKRSNSLLSPRSPSPSGRTTPSDSSSDCPSLPSSWTSWTSLTRSVSNPITRNSSWGKRNKHAHKFKSKSFSEPLTSDSSTSSEAYASSEELTISPTSSTPASPISTAPPSPALQPSKAGSVPAFPLASFKSSEITPIIISPPPPPKLNARALRRRARSTLVDTFRACVLPELGKRVRGQPAAESSVWEKAITSATTYYNWSMNSMIKRVERSLVDVVDEATEHLTSAGVEFGRAADSTNTSHSHEDSVLELMTATESSTITTTTETTVYESVEVSLYDSDPTCDTGGSSLRTPNPSSPILIDTTSHLHAISVISEATGHSGSSLPRPSARDKTHTSDVYPQCTKIALPAFPSVDSSTLSESSKEVIAHLDATYTALIALRTHLSEVLVSAKEREREAIEEAQARDDLLEVKCRRKAWLGKGWGLARSQGELAKTAQYSSNSSWWVSFQGTSGLAMPFRPSGLGQHTWTCEAWEYEPWYCFPGYCSDPEGHSHQNFQLLLTSRDDFESYYEDNDEDDAFSFSSSTSSVYQYQHSVISPEESDPHARTPHNYSSCARLRRSLDEGTPRLRDETFPETILPTSLPSTVVTDGHHNPLSPDLRTRGTADGHQSAIGGSLTMELETGTHHEEDEMVNSSPQNLPSGGAALFMECYTNPFENDDKALVRRGESVVVSDVQAREKKSDVLEDFDWAFPQSGHGRRGGDANDHRLGSSDLGNQGRALASSRRSSRDESFRSSLARSENKVFFPVSEEELNEETEHMTDVEFTVSIDIRDNPVFSPPAMPRSRKQSMQIQIPNDLGLDIVPRNQSSTAPCSPTSLTSHLQRRLLTHPMLV